MKSLNFPLSYFVFRMQNRQSGKRQSGTRGDKKQPTEEGGQGVGEQRERGKEREGCTITDSVVPIINSVSAQCRNCFRAAAVVVVVAALCVTQNMHKLFRKIHKIIVIILWHAVNNWD